MPEVHFKGKEFVFNHHLAVPYRPLVPDDAKSVGPADLSGNLLIHGDNLEALKALLPVYAGKVDCVFIDPPYNTGKEGWQYNDAVNSPVMREWLRKTVDRDDLLRHDKWLCMMWPRLRLLHELLSENGSIWITLDDNEVHNARAALDEIFGDQNFVATCIWHKMDSPKNTARHFSVDHDYVLVYAKNKQTWRVNLVGRTDEMLARKIHGPSSKRFAAVVMLAAWLCGRAGSAPILLIDVGVRIAGLAGCDEGLEWSSCPVAQQARRGRRSRMRRKIA
ncbi:MAG: site-specific DNA-methyltransferase [Acetobacteraceae bacterium]|nr:site-specific DNA-methyltransferase [Acetobacteraceae bacterium]